MFPVNYPRISKIGGKVSVVEKRFSKVTGEISAFYNSCGNSILCIYMFRIEAPQQAFSLI